MRPSSATEPLNCTQKLAALVEHGLFDDLVRPRSSIDWGIVRPSALAVLRLLMTRSNFVGRSTGRSPGLVPFRILSTQTHTSARVDGNCAPQARHFSRVSSLS